LKCRMEPYNEALLGWSEVSIVRSAQLSSGSVILEEEIGMEID